MACIVCNATLPDVPALLESPDQRLNPKQVKCVKCGSVASDARIACTYCDATFARPFSFSDIDSEFETDPRIAYYVITSIGEGACDACGELDGLLFTQERLPDYRMPIKTCKNPICNCQVMGMFADDSDAADIVAFLRKSGGVATTEQIRAHIDAKLAPERKRSAQEHANVELYFRACRAEKDSPEEAISLYRQSVQAWKATLRADPASRWDYLDNSYNRLTLMLERSKQFSQALGEIEDYRAFCVEMARKPYLETIEKREARLKRRLQKPN
jgi:hypothetical protein